MLKVMGDVSNVLVMMYCFFFFKQKTAYEMRISDWSSDVCSSDLNGCGNQFVGENELRGVDRVERQSVFHTFFIRNQDDIAVDADQLAVETLAPVGRKSVV